MNVYIISLLDAMAAQNITIFCNLNFVKSAVFFSDFRELSKQLKSVADFYYRFLTKVEFLPMQSLMMEHIGNFDFTDLSKYNPTVTQVFSKLNQQGIALNDILPIHLRYTDECNMHLVTGVAYVGNHKDGFLHLLDLSLSKNLIKNFPYSVTYVREMLESYQRADKTSIKDFVNDQGYCYNQFLRDCKIYFGDTFYSFILKLKMMDAIGDIIFTRLSLKEIAFKNKFLDYSNMYKTFVRYGLTLNDVPRLGNL